MGDVLILNYHAVSADWPSPLAVSPTRFSEHVSWLVDHGYRGITLSEAVAGASAPKAVALTFDDAYRSVFDIAWPILSTAGLTASVFALTALAGTERPMSWPGVEQWLGGEHRDELMPMSWGELDELAGAGWEIGSHTRTHPRLPELDDEALAFELRDSKRESEERLSRTCRSLAYPYGAYDARVIEAAREAGYTAAVGMLPSRLRPPTGPLDWARIPINGKDSLRRFRAKVSPMGRAAKSSPAWSAVAAVRKAAARGQSRPTHR